MSSSLDEIFADRRARIEARLTEERKSLELADLEASQARQFDRERHEQKLKHDDELHHAQLAFERQKTELRRQLAEAEAQIAQEVAAEQAQAQHALQLQTGGRATWEQIEREQAARIASQVDANAINRLTEAITKLVDLQNAPRIILRDNQGRPCGVKIDAPVRSEQEAGRQLLYDGGVEITLK